MASYVLYPPIVDSYMDAFKENYCKVYFSLSKYNATADINSIHVSICKQGTGANVVNKMDDTSAGRYRSTGIIIINTKPQLEEGYDNLYSFNIYSNDIVNGWTPGWIYKIQIRLSLDSYNPNEAASVWLNDHSGNFSEWSTVCTLKYIGNTVVHIPTIDYDSRTYEEPITDDDIKKLSLSTLTLFGYIEFTSDTTNEKLYKYSFQLYNEDKTKMLEDTGELYANKYQDSNSFKYVMGTELEDETIYNLYFNYETNNCFKETLEIKFIASLVALENLPCALYTVEDKGTSAVADQSFFDDFTSVQDEEEEGRLGIKIHDTRIEQENFDGNLCIRRCSSKDNFAHWTDIKIIPCVKQNIDDLPIFYDYTIESGVLYKYGIQKISAEGDRGKLEVISHYTMRNFEYSFLLGENNQQLKLQFNNTMGSYKIQMMESKTEPIGGMFPIVTRNAALRYRTFPINGTITFWMDEKNSFTNKYLIYNESKEYNHPIVDFYNQYNENNNIVQYDYIYERDFRKVVLDFLHDGKFKLFKSPTEGNIIVRLTDINCTPTQSLDRMIYDFTSTASEMAEATIENYEKYHFLELGEAISNFATENSYLGQIQMAFTPGKDNAATDIIKEIYKKYDSQGKNLAGRTHTVSSISYLKITIEDPPLRTLNSGGELVIGNSLFVAKSTDTGKTITIYGDMREYVFDERITFSSSDSIKFLGSEPAIDGEVINATIDFIYNLIDEPYESKKVLSSKSLSGMGQVFENYYAGYNIYKDIYYKYYIETEDTFKRLSELGSFDIEAEPGAIFNIVSSDTNEEFIINDTGLLRFIELTPVNQIIFVGYLDRITGERKTSNDVRMDIMVNYHYKAKEGQYAK